MRILAIRGKNLASLAGEFVVDFGAEPLASASLFAISGPTGAGKSTLLDAMCLALYHDTPRLRAATERSVTVPDFNDQKISPRDPRNLLRRGTADGWAEVDFEDRSGIAWRARWMVSRARKQATGLLQLAQASLINLHTQAGFAGNRGEIQIELVNLTGLSFEQFSRSVLLAQNEFAALLKAPQKERADLLEALTGTEIFQRISQLAHERNAAEQSQLLALEQQLQLIKPLVDAERAQLQDRHAQLLTHSAAEQALANTLQAQLAWHRAGAVLQERLASTQAQLRQTFDALHAQRETQQQLRRWNAVAQLRPLLDLHTNTLGRLQQLNIELPERLADCQSAATTLAQCAKASQTAQQRVLSAADQRERARPLIASVREADQQLHIRQLALETQRQLLFTAQQTQQSLSERQAALQNQHAQLRACVLQWTGWQTAQPQLQSSAERWPLLGLQLGNALAVCEQLQKLHNTQSDLSAQRAALQIELEHAQRSHAASAQSCAAATTDLRQAEALSAYFDADALEARRAACLQNQRQLERLQQSSAAHQQAQTRQTALRAQIISTQQRISSAEQNFEQAQQQAQQLTRDTLAARIALQRISLIADAHTEQLRELLLPGEPCPVCGAPEHPAANSGNAALRALLDTLRSELNTQEQALIVANQAQQDGATRLQIEQREHTRLAQDGELASAAVMQTAQQMRTAPQADLHDLASVLAALPALERALIDEQTAIDTQRSALQQTTAQVELKRQRERSARSQLDQAQTALQHSTHSCTAQETQLAQLNGQHQALQQQWHALLRDLPGPLLAELPIETPLRCQAAINAQLQLWQTGEALRLAAELAAIGLQRSAAEQLSISAQLSAVVRDIEGLQLLLSGAQAALRQTREQRVLWLSEPDVEVFAQRLATALDEAQRQLAHTQTRRHAAEHAHNAAGSAQLQAQREQASLQLQIDDLQLQLAAALSERRAELGMEAGLADLHAWLQATPADLKQRLAAWQHEENAARQLETLIDDLHAQITAWQRSQLPCPALPKLGEEAKALTDSLAQQLAQCNAALIASQTRLQDLDQQIGALRFELQQDDRRRLDGVQQMATLQAQRLIAQPWALLDELIGAGDGSKFKRYAQQFTLEVLIDYANEHIVHLARRYRLRRGNEPLSLFVIDSDLGDEVRSVHSLSGGETFLVSLALALGLASLSAQRLRVESLFIDEGFGSLDADTLNTAMEALDRLQAQGRRIGVISHVVEMAERIGVQIRVEALGAGKSRLRVIA